MFDVIVPCMFGLESVVSFEAESLGFFNVRAENGRVRFNCDGEGIARANIGLRTGERVLLCLAEFRAETFEELFQSVKNIDWQEWIGITDKFPVKGYSINSTLHSVPDCQAIIKKAVVEKLKSVHNISWFEESGNLYQIQFSIMKDMVSVMLDTTGTPLHKRGYREVSSAAPIKETIAAGLIDIARYKGDVPMHDPMCGSGTFVIEAAMRIKKAAPGLYRHFVSEQWPLISSEAWERVREEMKSAISRPAVTVTGSDIDASVVEIAKSNAEKAHVDDVTDFFVADVRDVKIEDGATIITNPPYGERLLDVESARELYRRMGRAFAPDKHKSFIISQDDEFEKFFGRPADKKRKIYNGMIRCYYYQYFKSVQK